MRPSARIQPLLNPAKDRPANSLDRLSGSRFAYEYNRLERLADPVDLSAYAQRTRALFAPVAKAFDDDLNTEWLLRSYLALKLILHATIMGTSAQFSEDKNIQVSVPYLGYYMLHSACRAFLLTCPDMKWTGPSSAQFSHKRAIDEAVNILKRLGPKVSEDVAKGLHAAKAQRELFSYDFPMSGMRAAGARLISLEDAVSLAGFFAEMAHLNTACLEGAVIKHQPNRAFALIEDRAWALMDHELADGEIHFDDEDWAWLGRLYRSHSAPLALTALVTEGMTEDFFGAWTASDDNREDTYDPDDNWRLLLDLW